MIGRTLAIILLLAAAACAGIDARQWLASTPYDMLTAGDVWMAVHRDSLRFVQGALEGSVAPWLWDPALRAALALPAWSIFGALALVAMWCVPARTQPRVFKRRYTFRPFDSGGGRDGAAR